MVQMESERQNTWADKKMAKNQDSVNYNSLHKSVLSSLDQSNVSVKLFNSQVRPNDHTSMLMSGPNDVSNREINRTTPSSQTFSRHEVKFEFIPKLEPIQVDTSKNDLVLKLQVVNKSISTWRPGMIFLLVAELDVKTTEEYLLIKEVQPEETTTLLFDVKKHFKFDTKTCKGTLAVKKGVDEVQKLQYFSEKYPLSLEFI